MPSKQTRRSISVRGTTYDALREYCGTQNKSMSEIVEEQLEALFGKPAAAGRAIEHAKPVAARVKTIANKILRAPAPQAVAPVAQVAPAPQAPPQKLAPVAPAAHSTASVSNVAVAVAAVAGSVGRPAPTPADEVIPERVKAPKGDYRTIRF